VKENALRMNANVSVNTQKFLRGYSERSVEFICGSTRNYESKFILDSFIFCVSPAKKLRRLAANVDFSTRSRVCTLVTFLSVKIVSIQNYYSIFYSYIYLYVIHCSYKIHLQSFKVMHPVVVKL
jgi:hypothetical protein